MNQAVRAMAALAATLVVVVGGLTIGVAGTFVLLVVAAILAGFVWAFVRIVFGARS